MTTTPYDPPPQQQLRTSTCKSCGARIAWVRTVEGRNMPMDVGPSEHGNLRVVGRMGAHPVVAAYADAAAAAHAATMQGLPDEPRWLSHFATCPNAAQHRKR